MKITRTTNRQRVMDAFALYGANGQQLSIGDIAKASGLSRTQVHGSAWVLAKEGKLLRIAEGEYVLASAAHTAAQSNGSGSPAIVPPQQGFLIPHVEWPSEQYDEAPIPVVPEPEAVPTNTEPLSSTATGLTAFLTAQFHLDPADVELALAFYDRFIAGQDVWNNGANKEKGK